MGVCCYTFLKYIVMIFNLLYMMLGGALLGTSLWVYLDGASMASVTKDIEGYNYVLFFLMAVGCVMFVMGTLGCCGACQESQCMLATFFALVFVLFVGQIAAGIWLKSNEVHFTDMITKSLAKSIKIDYGRKELKTRAFDVIQKSLECCGAEGPTDWVDAYINIGDDGTPLDIGISATTGAYTVPATCCNKIIGPACEEARKMTLNPKHHDAIHNEGCAAKMLDMIQEHSYEVLGVLGAILLIEILAMIFSMVLCCTVRRIDNVKA